MTQTLSQTRAWSQIVANAWADEDFKARLIEDPRGVLAEYGIDVPEGVELKVVEDGESEHHLVLPPSPAGDLFDEDLAGAPVAYCYSGFSGYCGRCGCACRCGRCE